MDYELPSNQGLKWPAADPRAYRSPRLRAKIVTASFVVYAAGIVAAAVLLWDALGAANAMIAGQFDEGVLADIERRGMQIEILGWGLTVLCAIAFCFWTHRVASNARAFGAPTTITPGWAVGYHFIPIVNLWRPYSALSEVWNGSDPAAQPGSMSFRTSGLLLAWWIAWIIGRFGNRVLLRDDVETPEQWITSLRMGFIALALEAVALGLAVAVVWHLTRRQEARAAALPEARAL